jgi:hypothetical protein
LIVRPASSEGDAEANPNESGEKEASIPQSEK